MIPAVDVLNERPATRNVKLVLASRLEGGSAMAKSMLIYAIGSLLIAWVFAHSIAVWYPSTWR